MRKLIIAALAAASILCTTTVEAATGVLVLFNSSKMVIGYDVPYQGTAFSCVTVYSILPLQMARGDTIVGKFDGWGSHTLYDATTDDEFNVYVDNYGVDGNSALDFFSGTY